MRLVWIAIGGLLTSSAMAGNFCYHSAFASDEFGNAIVPNLGEPYWVTVRYSVETTSQAVMTVRSKWTTKQSPAFMSFAGERLSTYGPLVAYKGGNQNVQVEIGDSGPQSITITPETPSSAIEYYNPQSWFGRLGASIQYQPAASPSLTWFLPKPLTFGFQSVSSVISSGAKSIVAGVFEVPKATVVEETFTVQSMSVRIDSAKLSRSGFSDLKGIPSDVKKYLKSESLIESGDRQVKDLVSTTLPKNAKRTMSVFAAAEALFKATVARIQYTEPDGRLPSAARALRTGFGDCGNFSAAFTSLCRNAGIPARPVTGFMEGVDAWHVWAEFYVPGSGWVPVDPSFADAVDPNGSDSVYFGVIPEMNRRVATAIGFEHSFGKYRLPMLQSPFAATDSRKIAAIRSTCLLSAIEKP